jgi:hypothetical protein
MKNCRLPNYTQVTLHLGGADLAKALATKLGKRNWALSKDVIREALS